MCRSKWRTTTWVVCSWTLCLVILWWRPLPTVLCPCSTCACRGRASPRSSLVPLHSGGTGHSRLLGVICHAWPCMGTALAGFKHGTSVLWLQVLHHRWPAVCGRQRVRVTAFVGRGAHVSVGTRGGRRPQPACPGWAVPCMAAARADITADQQHRNAVAARCSSRCKFASSTCARGWTYGFN